VAFTTNHEQVVLRLQEFPLIALYLSWLFPVWLTRLSIYPTMLFTTVYAVFFGPAVGTEHSQTLLNIAGLTFFTFLSITVGTFVRRRFEQGTEIDALTGALNRNGLSLRGEPALARALRSSRPITVALIDLDGFKQINDSQGHEAGDQVLVNLVAIWKQATRKTDLVCRLGGDEFVLLFPNTGLDDAQTLLGRTQSSSEYLWSYGLAQAIAGDNLSTMILRADRAMFENKRGRSERI
jgi:diguanylate cyclase (GGDEF)-like protein